MRFTHDGMPVKSIDVPDVEATAVAKVFIEFVAVPAWSVNVLVPDTAGANTVIAPLVSPEITTDDIYFLYKTTHRAPVGMVTVMPLLMVIGPVDMALKPVVRV